MDIKQALCIVKVIEQSFDKKNYPLQYKALQTLINKVKVDEENKLVICPFCKEDDFDLIGLKYHIVSGYCKVYNNTVGI